MRGQLLDEVTWNHVKKAHQRIRGKFGPSPLINMEPLNMYLGREVFLKAESLLPSGAFKLRGAFNKISSLSETLMKADIVTASSGNHALGVSLSAKWLGQKATVVVPESAPEMKKNNCRKLGAQVVERGALYDEAYEEARRICEAEGKYYVHPVADTEVVAGQGTIAVEIVQQLPEVEQIVVPLGGGGLVSGIAFAAKYLKPSIRIIAVQAEGSPLFYRCLQAKRLVELETADTIADGMACKKAEPFLFDLVKKYVDDVVVVPEKTIKKAIRVSAFYAKLVLEGAGAAALGAVLNGQVRGDLRTVILASGGNIDPKKLAAIINEGEDAL